jgi:hypothetical protein
MKETGGNYRTVRGLLNMKERWGFTAEKGHREKGWEGGLGKRTGAP